MERSSGRQQLPTMVKYRRRSGSNADPLVDQLQFQGQKSCWFCAREGSYLKAQLVVGQAVSIHLLAAWEPQNSLFRNCPARPPEKLHALKVGCSLNLSHTLFAVESRLGHLQRCLSSWPLNH